MGECRIYPLGSREQYRFVVILARYRNKWLYCRHNARLTWEVPGGHIEAGETPLEAAKRELWEETGAIRFSIVPVFDYWADLGKGGSSGVVFFASIDDLGKLPVESEMQQIELFEEMPEEQTYPDAQPALMRHFQENFWVHGSPNT